MNLLGSLIRKYRHKYNWTQSQLLEKIDLAIDDMVLQGVLCEQAANKIRISSREAISLWERGKRSPQVEIVEVLIKVFGLDTKEAEIFRRAASPATAEHVTPPFQAPRDVPYFVGRKEVIDLLAESLCSQITAIWGITGLGGIGKSALALHFAHIHRDRFPNGVLYASLRESDPSEALASFAAAYGEDLSTIHDLSARAAIVRSILGEKQVLIILDNSEDIETLRGVLGGCTTSCTVLLTTRDLELASAVTTGAVVQIPTFTKHESLALLKELAGKESVEDWDEASREICELLGGLPLAIEIAGRMVGNLHWGLARLRAKLRDEQKRLNILRVKDLDVRACFDRSYKQLENELKYTFAALGAFRGQPFDPQAASIVVGIEAINESLEALYNLSLLWREEKMFQQHPLLADLAREKLREMGRSNEVLERHTHYRQG